MLKTSVQDRSDTLSFISAHSAESPRVKEFVFNLGDDVAKYEGALEDIRRKLLEIESLIPRQPEDLKETMPLRQIFASGMIFRMKSLEVNNTQLSKSTRLSTKTIGRIVDGSCNPSTDTMEKIAEALGCTAIELIAWGY